MHKKAWPWLLALLLIGGLGIGAQVAKPPSIHIADAYRKMKFTVPRDVLWSTRWDKRFLLSFSRERSQTDSVKVLGADGTPALTGIISFPDAEVELTDAAVDNSGVLFVAGGTIDKNGVIAHFIAELNGSGEMVRIVRTTPFVPKHICSSNDDGTIWAYGFVRDAQREGSGGALLEQFSVRGGLLKSLFPRSALSRDWNVSGGDVDWMACNNYAVVVFSRQASELLRYDIASATASRLEIDPLPSPKDVKITGFCMTSDGTILASMFRRGEPPMAGAFQLTIENLNRGAWASLDETVGEYLKGASVARIVGTSGKDIVYSSRLDDTALSWSTISH